MDAPVIRASSELQPLDLTSLSDCPLVSVLMGNFNYAAYIGEAIQSVIAQTYLNWELVICDDGSTDESLRVIEPFVKRHPRIRLVTKPNGGHASALNSAYEASVGTIICLLDSDDLYLPTKIQRVVDCFLADSRTGMVAHKVFRVDKKRRKRGMWPLLASLPQGWCAPGMLFRGGVLDYLPPTTGLSLRRDVADLIFPVPAERSLQFAPDQVIMRLAPLVTHVASLDQALAEYRLHGGNGFETAHIDAMTVTRDIEICKRLWEIQHRFLLRFRPASAGILMPFESSPYGLFLRYIKAKFDNDPAIRRYYSDFMSDLELRPRSALKPFWSASLYLPGFIFGTMANLLLRQNRLKQTLANLRSYWGATQSSQSQSAA